jgi:signal transduction histidine kinase/CheY-like chemotaxis protein
MQKASFDILIVDDNRDLAQNMQDVCDAQGYGTAVAFDGRSAIELGRQREFDLVLIDIRLPDMDGLMLQEQLSALTPAEYVIITGYSSVESAVAAVNRRQIVGYKTKPVDLDHLLALIHQILERRQAEEELKNYREHLEEVVKERTAALQQEIEERKRTEVELRQAKEAALEALQTAEAANKLKSQFLANMSHDIRTPLNAVLGFAQILKERLGDFPQYQTYIHRIMEGGRTLLHLIDDILDLSRIEAGQMDIRPEAVNLPAVLNEIQQMFALKTEKKRIQLSTQISPDTPRTVLLDGNRLRQILMNLVGNAIKFTEKGSVTVRVGVCSHRFSDKERSDKSLTTNLLFEIEDTGIGIPQADQARIFEAFQQHAPEISGGTGLGLAITKRLVELMHGSIAVESTVNAGSLFRVLLPVTEIVALKEEGTARTELEQIYFHGATILLVEDDAANREVICAYLASCDLRLIEAKNGQEALQMLTPGYRLSESPLNPPVNGGKHENVTEASFPPLAGGTQGGQEKPIPVRGAEAGFRPDLILMDIRMPVMDGYDATQRLKADPELRAIPVVALTAYAIKEQKAQYQDIYDAYLSKPISKHDLIATLARFLPHTKVAVTSGAEEQETPYTSPDQDRVLGPPIMLADLRDYAAQTGPFPQALLDALRGELLPRHNEICEIMSVDEMIGFAEAIITAGDAFTIPPLKAYGEELRRALQVFDVFNMKRLLAVFPELIAIMTDRPA